MLPKSARCVYVGHEDGSGAIKHYNAQSHKILSSCNFHLMTKHLHQELTNPKPIIMLPDAEATTTAACEGGLGECTCNNGKRKAESSQNESIQPKPQLMDLTENAGNPLSEDPTKNVENLLSKNTWPISQLMDPPDPVTANTKRTQGVHMDYKKLNDPFSDDEENANEETLHTQYVNAAEIGGDIHRLAQA